MKSIYRELGYIFYCALLMPFGRGENFHYFGLNPLKLNDKQLSRRPIILLHGAKHNQSGWLRFARRLRKAKLGPIYTVNFTNAFDGKVKLRAKISAIRAQYGRDIEVDLVGHSLGAIIAAEYAYTQEPEPGTKVRKVVSIAGRLKLPKRSRFAFAYEKLKPQIEKLTQRFTKEPPESLYTVAADSDWLVPPESVLVAPAHQQLQAKQQSHLSVLYDSRTHEQIIEWLQSPIG